MVVFDATALLLLFRPDVDPPLDPATGKPVEFARLRMSSLVEQLEKQRTTIIVPAPALSELLVRAEQGTAELVAELQRSSVFRIEPFGARAAIELAVMSRELGHRHRDPAETYAKLKFDRQIVAIAKVVGSDTIYSDDRKLGAFADRFGIARVGTGDLPVPESAKQPPLPLPDPHTRETLSEPPSGP